MITHSQPEECKKFYQRTNKDVQHLGNERLNRLDISFWHDAGSVSIFIFDRKEVSVWAKGDIDGANTTKNAILLPITLLDPARKKDLVFEKKVKELTDSYKAQTNQYLLDRFIQEINLPQKKGKFINEGIQYFAGLGPSMKEMILSENSDRYVFINLKLSMMDQFNGDLPSMWKEPKVKLQAKLIVMVGKDKPVSEFIRNNDYLPLYPGPETAARFDPRIKAELRLIKSYPGIYLGSICKGTGFYSKKEWLSENGAFLEKEIKSLLEDLVKEAHKVFL